MEKNNTVKHMPITAFKSFIKRESASGVILLISAALAIISANTALAGLYEKFTAIALFPINDGLMAVFFLLVGLELKRGYLEGRLSTFAQIGLPAVAAMGGMLVPAAIYLLVNYHHPALQTGWAIPVATDIAFALGILSLFGKRVPRSLTLFLLALAIFDDLGAILVIALFYTDKLIYLWMLAGLALLMALIIMNALQVKSLRYYLPVGMLLWFCVLKSGIHPTIAGVLIALIIPAEALPIMSPLHRLEHQLQPWVAFFIMPLFAFANAGLSFTGMHLGIILEPMVLGITAGLFIGKQLGVLSFATIFIKSGYARLPKGSSWLGFYAIAILCGIGFTMSLFLGTLSFQNQPHYLTEVRLGVILGSLLSSLLGAGVLSYALKKST